ncbi:FAD-dependent pyridine nucleotide-disulfide oxidoreductase [Cladochytrium replicatum]|nr:FAD-dependent pyridine nucleotide-disulfide oxidoreductase [Cladochytrium replicatum]
MNQFFEPSNFIDSIATATNVSRFEAAIIGGSFSGLSAALQLARARRNVVVIDASEPRNRFAAHSHGFLTQDGTPPHEISAIARAQLLEYPTVTFHTKTRAVAARHHPDSKPESPLFEIDDSNGVSHIARRVIFAAGLQDKMPSDVPGFKENWGAGIFHCPYCHGYELRDKSLGVLGVDPKSVMQAYLLHEWSSDITFFSLGAPSGSKVVANYDSETLSKMRSIGIKVEDQASIVRIVRDEADPSELSHVELSDGRRESIRGLLIVPTVEIAPDVLKMWHSLGVETNVSAFGHETVTTADAFGQTNVRGVYFGGDGIMNVAKAVSDGALAGVGAHHSLVAEKMTSH